MIPRILSVVTADQRTLFSFSDRALDWFTHFRSHQPAKIVLLRFKNCGRSYHHRLAFLESRTVIGTKSVRGALQSFVDFRLGKRFEGLYRFTVSRINGCDGHCFEPRSELRDKGDDRNY